MDVEHRTGGLLYNSELPSPYVGLPINNSQNMNQFVKPKSKLRKQSKSGLGSSSTIIPNSLNLTPTFDVLPKIEANRYSSINDQYGKDSTDYIQSSTNNSSITTDIEPTDLPISEAFTKNNVDEWLQMPVKNDSVTNTTGYSAVSSSTVSSNSGNMLTPVEVDYFTDCTSVTSSEWGDDVCEFDKNESNKVNQMFEEIEWMLFNDSTSSIRSSSNRANRSSSFSSRNGILSGPVHLRRECSEWTHQFPHFRLVGRQISLPQEQGYTFNDSERSGSVTPKNSPRILVTDSPPSSDITQSRWVSASSDLDRLSLVGQAIRVNMSEIDPSMGFDELSVGSSQEEVFAMDGDMVEIIAIDYKMDEDYSMRNEKKVHSKHALFRNGKGYPPITPNAVIRDAVLTAIFDNLWSHIVDWVLPLLTRLYQSCSSRDMVVMENPEPNQMTYSITPDIYRVSKPFSQIPTLVNNLDNILKISTKTLQFREKSYLQSIPEQSQNFSNNIKNSFSLNYGPKNPLAFLNQIRRPSKVGLAPDRSHTPLSVNESSFLHDKELKRTPPLNQSYYVSSIAAENLSPLRCLRGKALYQSHSPELLARSGTLPPIHKYSALTHFRPPGSRIGSAHIHNSPNQSSSIVNQSLTAHVLMSTDIANMRPCTSHTARSDQAGGNRSSTPSGTRGSLNLNVHGSSITMNSLSMKPNEELPYDQLNKYSRTRPYWKTYNNQMQTTNKRNKSLYNSVK